jgi:hypothetical protein
MEAAKLFMLNGLRRSVNDQFVTIAHRIGSGLVVGDAGQLRRLGLGWSISLASKIEIYCATLLVM